MALAAMLNKTRWCLLANRDIIPLILFQWAPVSLANALSPMPYQEVIDLTHTRQITALAGIMELKQ